MEKVKIINTEDAHREYWEHIGKLMQEGFEEGLRGGDTKAPNPIYIPKNVQHRKKGRK